MKSTTLCAILIAAISLTSARGMSDKLKSGPWDAWWVAQAKEPINLRYIRWNASLQRFGVYEFAKDVEFSSVPEHCLVYVSADQGFKLSVNGKMVAAGPKRGDIQHWAYESVDIAPFLKPGTNTFSAQVWNQAQYKPQSLMSYGTGFILQADDPAYAFLNTDESWLVREDSRYSPILAPAFIAGNGIQLDMLKTDGLPAWENCRKIMQGKNDVYDYLSAEGWILQKDSLPLLKRDLQSFGSIRKIEGLEVTPDATLLRTNSLKVPPHATITLLIDQGLMTNAYPVLHFSGGRGASIEMRYAETLFTQRGKGNRNEVDGKLFNPLRVDRVLSSGERGVTFTSLLPRTFRYVEIFIANGEAALEVENFESNRVEFPFAGLAEFASTNPVHRRILDQGFRTFKICSVDQLSDNTNYEDQQYCWDGSIAASIAMYYTGDDRLVKNAINMWDYSRNPEGFINSRYPSTFRQQIAQFALRYITFLHEYFLYGSDPSFVKSKLSTVRSTISYFEKYELSDGSLVNVPQWNWADWAVGWKQGIPPKDKNGCSAVLDLYWMQALQSAAQLEDAYGLQELKHAYLAKAERLKQTINVKYWDAARGLYADNGNHDTFSRHANAYAILAEMRPAAELNTLAKTIIEDKTLTRGTPGFRYFLDYALGKAGHGSYTLTELTDWTAQLDAGLTTWAESPNLEATRSDCQQWAANSNVNFFRVGLGIDSIGAGFSKVRIRPQLGSIEDISGSIPHPRGKLSVSYKKRADGWHIKVTLPEGTDGVFVWGSKEYPLKSGDNSLQAL